jgi:glycosyltransferase involved in cell wall biosynthesis
MRICTAACCAGEGSERTLRRRYLMLVQNAPWKLNGGALIRNYWMAIGVARHYDLDLVVAESAGPPPAEFAQACASIIAFPRPTGGAYTRARIADALRPSNSYFTAGQVTRAQAERVAAMVREKTYAAIHVGDLNQHVSLPNVQCPPVWYDAHNCEAELVRRQASYERFPMNLAVRLDALRVRGVEGGVVRRAIHISACSEQDVADLDRMVPGAAAKSTVIPNGVDVARYAAVRDAAPQRGCITLTGSMDWRPTQQGLLWFVERVLPLLPATAGGVEIEVRVAGRMTPALVERLSQHPRLIAVPNPLDMRDELSRAHIIAVPVLASSGSRLRLLEAWAAGRPVVTTPSGAFGLPHEDGADLISVTTPEAFAAACVRLIEDSALWGRVREGGFARVGAFDWPRIADRIVAMHQLVIP